MYDNIDIPYITCRTDFDTTTPCIWPAHFIHIIRIDTIQHNFRLNIIKYRLIAIQVIANLLADDIAVDVEVMT